jgi:hypothetical protein
MKAPLASRFLEWIIRLLGALALGSFGGLLLWITGLILTTPMPGEHPLALLAFRLFVLCILGVLGLALSVGAGMMVIPGSERRLTPEIPRNVLRLCPGCGHSHGPRKVCPGCGLPPPPTGSHWIPGRLSSRRSLLLLPALGGAFFFGVFLLVRLLTERPSSPALWREALLVALALIALGAGLFGVLATAFLRRKEPRSADYVAFVNLEADLPALRHVAQAELTMNGSEIREAQGSLVTSYQARGKAEAEITPEDLPTYRFLAAASLRGYLRFARQRRIEWRLSPTDQRDGDTSSYRDAPEQDPLTRSVSNGCTMLVSLTGFAPGEAPDEPLSLEGDAHDPLQGLLVALHGLKTVEHLVTLAREDAPLQQRLLEQLAELSAGLDEEKLSRQARRIAAW